MIPHVNPLLTVHLLFYTFASAALLPHPQSIVQNPSPIMTELARFNLSLPSTGDGNNTLLTIPHLPAQDPYHIDVEPNWRLTLFDFGDKIIKRHSAIDVAIQAQAQAGRYHMDTALPHRVTDLRWRSRGRRDFVYLGCSLSPDRHWEDVWRIGYQIHENFRSWDTVTFFFDITEGPGGASIGTGFLML